MFNSQPKKETDYNLKKEKRSKEFANYQNLMSELKSKYSEKLKESPIKMKSSVGIPIEIKNIYKLSTDLSGDGQDVGVNFETGDKYFYTDRNGKINDRVFNDIYKTDEESIQTITTIMTDLINRSGYSDAEKNKMQSSVINHLNSLVKKD
jgi:hypothetical protein